jgi:4-amino-4-deoxy-L-arabinose transferase-like glycosyltransferase
MKNSATRDVFVAGIAVIATLAPFLNKAFHIDDPLFLWIAQQITRHPQDPYGFDVNWYVTSQPMFWVMQNPPLTSYYMALVASFLGWTEPAMHCAFLLPAGAAVIGTFFLGRRLCHSPLLAALLLLFTPVFLVSATGVMCDVWLLALWVWSIECWMCGLEQSSALLLFLASLLVAAAALTKYFGVALVPLLAVYTAARERRLSYQQLYLLIPILIIISYELTTRAMYGHGLFSSGMLVSWNENAKLERHFLQRLLVGLSFAGGCLFSVLFFAPLLRFRRHQVGAVHRTAHEQSRVNGRLRAGGARSIAPTLAVAGGIFLVLLLLFHFDAARTALPLGIATQGALFATIGIGILTLALADILQHKTADSLLLGLWVFGTFIFAATMNWTITSRTFLPMAPAIVIVLIRRLRDRAVVAAPKAFGAATRQMLATWWPVLPSALISFLVAIGDYHLAHTARLAANQFRQRFANESGSVWFEGHWGFQYYMQQWGAKSLDAKNRELVAGDILVVPLDNTNVGRTSPAPTIGPIEEVNYPQFFVATMNPEIHAGFYASNWGPLPWVVGPVPPERYLIFHIK